MILEEILFGIILILFAFYCLGFAFYGFCGGTSEEEKYIVHPTI